MDRSNGMERVQRSLEELEVMVSKQKADRNEMYVDMQVERLEADIRRRGERCDYDNFISLQRDQFDKSASTKHSELAKRVRTEQIAMLNKALNDLRATYDQKIEQERALSNEVLQKTRAENDANLKKERQNFDSMIEQAREQLDESENERLMLKTLIQREEVRPNMNVEEEDIIHIPRKYMPYIIEYECHPDVVMRFKLHAVKEIYSDLQKYYDGREELAEIGIRDVDTVEYCLLTEILIENFGYTGDALLYYLNPAPGSQPSTALIKIDGQEDVDKMVDAHAHERKKYCHLYIVNGTGFSNNEERPWQPDDDGHPYQSDEEDCPSGRAEEVPEQDNTSPVMKKRRAGGGCQGEGCWEVTVQDHDL